MPEFERSGVRLAYLDEGSGPPTVLVHGAASSHRCFDQAVPELAREVRVIAPDLRGMGDSGRVTTLDPADWEDDLLALIDHLGLEQVHLCGTSLGARVATRFTL